jgi:hypothetical protein
MATATAPATTNSTGLPAPDRVALVPIDKITRDQRVNTRDVDPNWVQARVKRFRPDALGIPAVSQRADGTFVVVDGQNRIALCQACDYGPGILCEIYTGLDLAQEAGLFVLLNSGRAVTPGHRFKARVTQGDPVACAILKTAELAGWKVDVVPGPGVITAVSTLERLWKDDERHHPDDPQFVLASTLQTIVQAWQHDLKAGDSAIIGGIGALFVRHGLAIDTDHMVQQLMDLEGGPQELLYKSSGLKRVRGGSVANSVAELVTDAYNQGRRSRKLPRWR